MLTLTHIALAKNTLKFLKSKGFDILDEKSFIYGNIKPDNLFQKTPKIHLETESLPFVLNQIDTIIDWDIDDKKKLFSLELGIICHFLCDYFCLPHFERWSACPIHKKVKETPRHLNYERILSGYTKSATMEFKEIEDLVMFLEECKKEYVLEKSFENDIKYASLVCNSVSLYILEKQKEININK